MRSSETIFRSFHGIESREGTNIGSGMDKLSSRAREGLIGSNTVTHLSRGQLGIFTQEATNMDSKHNATMSIY